MVATIQGNIASMRFPSPIIVIRKSVSLFIFAVDLFCISTFGSTLNGMSNPQYLSLSPPKVSGVGCQVSENREPQNTEQGIMNVEGKKTSSFEILAHRSRLYRDSIFDIQNSKN
jgi:hypothetical protein